MANLQNLIEKVQKAIPAYCKTKGIAHSAIPGINAATVSNILNGKWENISEKNLLRIWNKVKPQAEIYQTTDCKAGLTACEKAAKNCQMIGIIADTGMSKTTVCQTVAMRPNTYYMYIDSTVTPKVFLRHLLGELGAAFDGSLHDMLAKVVNEINTQNSPLLLIDECAKLSDKMMLLIHSLRDRTKDNCGIVLAGMPDFKNKLIKFSNKGTTGYAEFFRRIEIWHEFKGLTAAEIKYILQDNGITDADDQREFRNYKRIGDLMNAIKLFKEVND